MSVRDIIKVFQKDVLIQIFYSEDSLAYYGFVENIPKTLMDSMVMSHEICKGLINDNFFVIFIVEV